MKKHRKLHRRERKLRNKKIIIASICLIGLMSVGFAAFQTQISLTAKGNIKVKPVAFSYTGEEQTYTITRSGTYKLEVWGAQGGLYCGKYGAYGGYSIGQIKLEKGTNIYILVGGKGEDSLTLKNQSVNPQGGFNGGGNGGLSSPLYNGGSKQFCNGAGGGGATHIATKSGLLSSLENYQDNILIVAGGGAGTYSTTGGHGGGIAGNFSIHTSNNGECVSYGGTQTAGYMFGQGQNAKNKTYGGYEGAEGNGGGGGGFYGGYSFQDFDDSVNMVHVTQCGGGGGSGYIGNSLLTDKVMYCYNCEESTEVNTKTISTTNVSEDPISNYAKRGNGYAKITYISQ